MRVQEQGASPRAACAGQGNSEDIAKKHYYQVTEAHFETAAGLAPLPAAAAVAAPAPAGRLGRDHAESNAPTTQNTTQQPGAG